jgi:hypothetical protein
MQHLAHIGISSMMGRNSVRVPILKHRKEAKSWRGSMHKAAPRSKNLASAEDQEGQEAKFQQLRHGQVLSELFRRTPGSSRRDYYTSGNHEDLQGIKDPRGPVGIHATRERGLRVARHRSGA